MPDHTISRTRCPYPALLIATRGSHAHFGGGAVEPSSWDVRVASTRIEIKWTTRKVQAAEKAIFVRLRGHATHFRDEGGFLVSLDIPLDWSQRVEVTAQICPTPNKEGDRGRTGPRANRHRRAGQAGRRQVGTSENGLQAVHNGNAGG